MTDRDSVTAPEGQTVDPPANTNDDPTKPDTTTAVATAVGGLDPSLPLLNTWVFYFDDGNFHPPPQPSTAAGTTGATAPSSADFLTHLVQLGSFNSIQNFWKYFNSVDLNIHKICRHGRFNLRLFKKGIQPIWDQPSQIDGGRWVLKATPSSDLKKTREIWFELLMAVVGEQLPLADTISGCVLACKPHRNEVQLWVSAPPFQTLPTISTSTEGQPTGRTPEEEAAAAATAQQLALVNQQSHDLKLKSLAHSMRRLLRLSDSVRMSYIPHSYEIEKARSHDADHATREREREDRHKVKAVKSKTSKSQTWPIRPPEEFMNPPPKSAEKKKSRMGEETSQQPPSEILSPSQQQQQEEQPGAEPDSSAPGVDEHLLAAMSLSANVLHEDPLPTPHAQSILHSPCTSIPTPSEIPSGISATPPTNHRRFEPSDFQRFLISKDSTPASTASETPQHEDQDSRPPNILSPNLLQGPLASLLGLTTPSPRSGNSQNTPTPQNVNQSGGQLFSPASAPMICSPPPGFQPSPVPYAMTPSQPMNPSFMAPASMASQPLLQQPFLGMPPGFVSPNSQQNSQQQQQYQQQQQHPAHISGVHVLNSMGRPSALTSSAHLFLPVTNTNQTGGPNPNQPYHHMSRAERKQAQQWLDRVASKQEQSKSWPRGLLPNPMPMQLQQQQQQPQIPSQQQMSMPTQQPLLMQQQSHPPRTLSTTIPAPILVQPHPMAPNVFNQRSLSNTTPTQTQSSPYLGPPTTSSNSDLVRTQTDANAKHRPSLSKSITPVGSRSSSEINVPPTTTTPTVAVSPLPSATIAPITACPSAPVPAPAADPLLLECSPTAAQIYIAGALPALELTGPAPPDPSPSRPRSRSLFNNGGTCSPFTSTLASPLLAAFKDAQAAAVAEAAQQKRLALTASGTPIRSKSFNDTTTLISASPPILDLNAHPDTDNAIATTPVTSHHIKNKSSNVEPIHLNIQISNADTGTAIMLPSPDGLSTSNERVSSEEENYNNSVSISPSSLLRTPSPTHRSSSNSLIGEPLDWEKQTRLEHGLPPIPPSSSSTFKTMSRSERKAALAMLSKVSSKRQQSKSLPIRSPTANGTPESPSLMYGSNLAVGPLLSPIQMSPMGERSPNDSPRGARAGGHSPYKPSAAALLTVDTRALSASPAAPAPNASPSMLSKGVNMYSPNPTMLLPMQSPPPPYPAMYRSISANDTMSLGSGATTPSGGHTPGGRSVTLGMGLRSRTKSGVQPGTFPPMSPPPAVKTLGTRLTPTNSTHASPSPSSHPSPQLMARSLSANSPSVQTRTLANTRKLSNTSGIPTSPAPGERTLTTAPSSSILTPPNLLLTPSPSPSPLPSYYVSPPLTSPVHDVSPNRPLYIIIGLLTLLLIVMTLLLLKARQDSHLTSQLEQLLRNQELAGQVTGTPTTTTPTIQR